MSFLFKIGARFSLARLGTDGTGACECHVSPPTRRSHPLPLFKRVLLSSGFPPDLNFPGRKGRPISIFGEPVEFLAAQGPSLRATL